MEEQDTCQGTANIQEELVVAVLIIMSVVITIITVPIIKETPIIVLEHYKIQTDKKGEVDLIMESRTKTLMVNIKTITKAIVEINLVQVI